MKADRFFYVYKTVSERGVNVSKKELTKLQRAERSLIKTYRKEIWHPFVMALEQYGLLEEGDRIAVCISGGKDSFILAKLMQEFQRHGPVNFKTEFIAMDPGYTERNRVSLEENAKELGIPIHIFETNIFRVADMQEKNQCYLCAKMRRGCLYSKARELGCNKIALGHHMDDVIETTLMSMFYSSQIRSMIPKLKSLNYPGMELIRPLYRIREKDIIKWADYTGLTFKSCDCFGSRMEKEGNSKRAETKALIRQLEKENPGIAKSLFRSIHSVALDTLPGYTFKEKDYTFLDNYDD